MASTYSTNLRLELIGTGDQSGTWGNTTNTNLGTLIEEAIAGYVTQTVTDGAATVLTIPNGASSNGRNYVIALTGTLTAARTVEVPAVDKPYIFFNNTTGGYAVTVKVSGQTGVTIANGKKAIVYTNSTDVIEVANAPVTEAGTQTLTNKTLTSPTINTATLSSPTVTGVATFAAGTVSAPAITTTGDTNTGIFFPAADTIAFGEGGAEAMRINSSGSVGIGVTSPITKLDVSGSINFGPSDGSCVAVGATTTFTPSGGAATAYYGMTFGGFTTNSISLSGFNGIALYTGSGSERMRIDSSGNVGIGQSAPVTKVQTGGTGANSWVWINPNANAVSPNASITSGIAFGGNYSAGGSEGNVIYGTYLTFAKWNGTTYTESARISSAGGFSVGTASDPGAGYISDKIGNVRSVPQNAQTTGYTLVASDNGKHISITTGGVTVPSGVFSAGDVISIYNNSGSSQTITQGGSVTMYLAGTATTGNRTLAQRGLVTVLCVASNTFVINGGGLT
jgi:hypothetical protein